MLSVIIPIVTALAGAVAAAVPILAVSERRRLLKFIEDESTALKAVEEPGPREQMANALFSSTARYQWLASMSPTDKARRRIVVWFPAIYVVMALGLAAALGSRWLFTEDYQTLAIRGGMLAALSAGVVLFLLGAGLSLNRMDDRRQAEALVAEQDRRETAEHAVDEVAEELDAVASNGTAEESREKIEAIRRRIKSLQESRPTTSSTRIETHANLDRLPKAWVKDFRPVVEKVDPSD